MTGKDLYKMYVDIGFEVFGRDYDLFEELDYEEQDIWNIFARRLEVK